jgi:hypothetical protein
VFNINDRTPSMLSFCERGAQSLSMIFVSLGPRLVGETITRAIALTRPDWIVVDVDPANLEWAMENFTPAIVLCSEEPVHRRIHGPPIIVLSAQPSAPCVLIIDQQQTLHSAYGLTDIIELINRALH